MKKIALLLVTLVLCMSLATASAEYATQGQILDLEAFTLTLNEGDVCQTQTKTNGGVWKIIFPQYDENALTRPNMNVVWMEDMVMDEMKDMDLSAYATQTATNAANQASQQGIPCQLQGTPEGDYVTIKGKEFAFISYNMIWDYTEATGGLVGETELIFLQLFTDFEGYGSYIITMTGYAEEQLDAMLEQVFTTIDFPGAVEDQPVSTANGEMLDLGDFTLVLQEKDLYQPGSEKISGEIMAYVYPNYSATDATHANMNFIWVDSPLGNELNESNMQQFAESTIDAAIKEVNNMGIPCELVSTQPMKKVTIGGKDAYMLEYVSDWDYTEYTGGRLGLTQLTTIQLYVDMGNGESYVISMGATDADQLNSLVTLLNTIDFK